MKKKRVHSMMLFIVLVTMFSSATSVSALSHRWYEIYATYYDIAVGEYESGTLSSLWYNDGDSLQWKFHETSDLEEWKYGSSHHLSSPILVICDNDRYNTIIKIGYDIKFKMARGWVYVYVQNQVTKKYVFMQNVYSGGDWETFSKNDLSTSYIDNRGRVWIQLYFYDTECTGESVYLDLCTAKGYFSTGGPF